MMRWRLFEYASCGILVYTTIFHVTNVVQINISHMIAHSNSCVHVKKIENTVAKRCLEEGRIGESSLHFPCPSLQVP